MGYFFDIPVYRLTEKKYEADQEAFIKRELDELCKSPYVAKMFEGDSPEKLRERDRFRKKYGGPWKFNEIIGFIRLHFLSTQVRGEWWRVDADRVTRSRTKRFQSREWKITYEEEIPPKSTNKEIYEIILKYLARAQKERYVKRFHIDLDIFKTIGPHVDWNAILKKETDHILEAAAKAREDYLCRRKR